MSDDGGPAGPPVAGALALPPTPAGTITALAGSGSLADGEWHRPHPLTPFLRGGLALIAMLGIIAVNTRDFLLHLVLGGPDRGDSGDPVGLIVERGLVGVVAAVGVGVLLLLIAGFWLSWRFDSYRVSDEVVEVRRGVLARSHRRARLDRIQSITLERPFLARIVGAARLQVEVAGQDANVKLEYLPSRAADALRRDILTLASGARAGGRGAAGTGAAGAPAGAAGGPAAAPGLAGVAAARAAELLGPELDPTQIPVVSVVPMHPGRLLGSTVLSGALLWLIVFSVGPVILFPDQGRFAVFAFIVPVLIAVIGFVYRRVTRFLRYTIASTPDGIRIGYGLLSTANETLPPGRIHGIEITQPLLWRPFGWWRIRINRAATHRRDAGGQTTILLPVGDRGDVARVLALMLPGASEEVLATLAAAPSSRGEGGGFRISPPRARLLRPLSRRRNGVAVVDGLAVLRRGAVWRTLVIVPLARVQGVSQHQGPVARRLALAGIRLHTVAGPVSAHVGALDAADVRELAASTEASVVTAVRADHAHRWGSDARIPDAGGAAPA